MTDGPTNFQMSHIDIEFTDKVFSWIWWSLPWTVNHGFRNILTSIVYCNEWMISRDSLFQKETASSLIINMDISTWPKNVVFVALNRLLFLNSESIDNSVFFLF